MKYTVKRLLGYVGRYKYPAFLTIACMIETRPMYTAWAAS